MNRVHAGPRIASMPCSTLSAHLAVALAESSASIRSVNLVPSALFSAVLRSPMFA